MADSYITVYTHGSQSESAGKHVVVVDSNDRLAQCIPKWPEAQKDVCALEGQCQQDQGISQCQIKYVNVGSSLHLGVHDEAVPQEPPDAHSQVEPHDGDLESKGQEGTVASIEEQVMGYGLI